MLPQPPPTNSALSRRWLVGLLPHCWAFRRRRGRSSVLRQRAFPPSVRQVFLQTSFTTVGANRLVRGFLLGDPLVPQFAALRWFRLHSYAVHLAARVGQMRFM